MGRLSRRFAVDETTYSMVINECVQEFLKHHPEFQGMTISQNFIIRKIAEFYLKM